MKSKWKSKTWWASLITSAAGLVGLFVPEVSTWVSTHSEEILTTLGLLFAILRIKTKEPVS